MRELRWIRVLGLVVPLLLAGVPARAADAATDAIQAAYAPYRAALVRTNAKAQAESERAIADAIAAWRGVVERLGAAAPPAVRPRRALCGHAGRGGFDLRRRAAARARR